MDQAIVGIEDPPGRRRDPVRRDPVRRVFELLRTMIDLGEDEYGVRELAAHARIPPSTAHRLLGALEDAGMVAREGDGGYGISLEFQRLALRATNLLPLKRTALEPLEQLRRACGETVLLCVYEAGRRRMMFAEALETADPLRYAIELNTWVPIHTGASGRSIMAFLPEEEREELLTSGPLELLTEQTIDDVAQLRAALEAVRERGLVTSHGERIPGAVGVAAPIFGARQQVLGSVCVTLPEFRYSQHDPRALEELVAKTARDISLRLGGKA